MRNIYEVVRGATVVITAEDDAGGRGPVGSGFFVAPGWVLSCAHVVAPAREPRVHWRGHDLIPLAHTYRPAAAGDDGRFAFPDTAVLRVPVPDPAPPCVPISLAPPVPTHRAWACGVTRIRTGLWEPFATDLVVADAGPGDEPGLLRLQGGQLGFGMSGGPVLDIDTYEVCGIAKSLQCEKSDLGGWAIPVTDALSVVDEPLAELNAAYHADSLNAMRRGQVTFGWLPDKVLTMLADREGALKVLAHHLATAVGVRAPVLHPEDVPEWLVRQLFALDLDDLVAAIVALRHNLDLDLAMEVFDHVACCLPVGGVSAWVTGDAAYTLRQEAARDRPRIVRVCTDREESVAVLMCRAFEGAPWSVSPVVGPASAQVGDGGLPADWLADLRAEIARRSGAAADDTDEQILAEARRRWGKQNKFLKVPVDAAPDAALLRALAGRFAGLRFLISKRRLTLPEGVDDVVLDLVPPIDPRTEGRGVASRDDLLGTLRDTRKRA